MIKFRVEVEDFDTGTSTELILPTDLDRELDLSHDIMITDWDEALSCGMGEIDDIEMLNLVFDALNAGCPNMTLELLNEILYAANSSLSDLDLIERLCDNDFMLEEVSIKEKHSTNAEQCARHLATVCGVPFAKSVSGKALTKMNPKVSKKIDWEAVWDYYRMMGFVVVETKAKLFVGNFEEAEDIE